MISSEVQRTLVKSPPELWAELSDPESLARHLSLDGEVRVTRSEPERAVEWEAESASGTVELAASGWGTRVKLSLTRAEPEAEMPSATGAAEAPQEATGVPEEAEATGAAETPDATEATGAAETPDATEATGAAGTPGATSATGTPRRRTRSLFARLFRRRAAADPSSSGEASPEPDELVQPVAGSDGEGEAASQPAPDQLVQPVARSDGEGEAASEPAPDQLVQPVARSDAEGEVASQPAPDQLVQPVARSDAEGEVASEPAPDQLVQPVARSDVEAETTDLLNGVLDRLGAAHHRPFSRS